MIALACYTARPFSRAGVRSDAVKIESGTPVSGIAFVAFDTETTGLDLVEDRLLDVGAVRFRLGKVERAYESLVKPGRTIPDYSIAIHHITEAMVADAPAPRKVLAELCEVLDGAVMIAHNAPFDMAVLTAELARQKMPVPDMRVLDTCVLAEALMPEQPTLKLGSLMGVLGSSETNDHRALPDARCVIRLFEHLCQRVNGGAPTWQDLMDRHGPAFELRAFAQLAPRDQWHFAVAVNAIEERRSVRVSVGQNGQAPRDLTLSPRGFALREGGWCVVPEKPAEPVRMDAVREMVKVAR